MCSIAQTAPARPTAFGTVAADLVSAFAELPDTAAGPRVSPVESDGARGRLLLVLGLAVALANFVVNLGTGSLFIDEVYSWRASSVAFAAMNSRIRLDEVAPPLYYWALHEWIFRGGSQSAWMLRVPSALAGIALVSAVYWLGGLVADRTVGGTAALLAALSPLVLEYAQQVRAYIFVMLLVTLSVALILQSERSATRSRLWLALGGLAMVLALWTHYTANLVLVPLIAWLWWRQRLDRRTLIALTALLLAADAVVAPLAHTQLGRGHQHGVAAAAGLTLSNLIRNLGSPFDGRIQRVTIWVVLGALVTVAAFAVAAARWRRTSLTELLLILAGVPLVSVVAVTIVGTPSLLTRYDAVGAPFVLVLIAIAVVHGSSRTRWLLAAVAVAAAVGGSLLAHAKQGYFPDLRDAMSAIGRHWHPGDAVYLEGYPAIGSAVQYYLPTLPAGAPVIFPSQGTEQQAVAQHRPFWVLASRGVPAQALLPALLARIGYRITYYRTFPATNALTVVHVAPVQH
jgi:4-amino-4-deoxy-L-arabinose transferase-like glycosyltransferase